jgi:integrase
MNRDIVIKIDNLERAKQVLESMDITETTREDYKARIGVFLAFIEERGGLNPDSFLMYKRALSEKTDIGISTKNKYLATARVFLKELNRRGLLSIDITQNIKSFRQDKKHKKDGLNDKEIKTLTTSLQALPDTFKNTRVKAIIALLIYQGLRQVEVSRLQVRDLDLLRDTAFIQGKGRDDKEIIYLHPETTKQLKLYLRLNKVKDGYLFTSQSNNNRNGQLTTKAIRNLVKDTLGGLEIDKSVHGFRHYFTTQLIKTYKGDLLEVMRYTRHRSLEMLQVYNDGINRRADLPRFYGAFEEVRL